MITFLLLCLNFGGASNRESLQYQWAQHRTRRTELWRDGRQLPPQHVMAACTPPPLTPHVLTPLQPPHLLSHYSFSHQRSWSCCAISKALSAPTSTSATRDATSTTAAPAPGWCAPSSWCTARRWTAWGKTALPLATSGRAPRRIKRWVALCQALVGGL